MNQIQQAGVTLDTDKCESWRDELTFLRHVVSYQVISPDPGRLKYHPSDTVLPQDQLVWYSSVFGKILVH